jgi:hypothetical protein
MIGTLMATCYVMDVVFYLWYCYVMFYLLSLKSHSLGKVFRCSFLVTTRKVFFLEVVSWRDMAGMARRGANYWLVDIPIGRGITPPSIYPCFLVRSCLGFLCFVFCFCFVMFLCSYVACCHPSLPSLFRYRQPLKCCSAT